MKIGPNDGRCKEALRTSWICCSSITTKERRPPVKFLSVSLLLLLIVALIVTNALIVSNFRSSKEKAAEALPGQISMVLTANCSQFQLGKPMEVDIIVSNATDVSCTLAGCDIEGGNIFDFVMTDKLGTPVPISREMYNYISSMNSSVRSVVLNDCFELPAGKSVRWSESSERVGILPFNLTRFFMVPKPGEYLFIASARFLLKGKNHGCRAISTPLSVVAVYDHKTSNIYEAARAGDIEKVQAILKVNPDLVNSKESSGGATPLHLATASGHKDMIELLLADNADVKAKDDYGWTPLHFAAFSGRQNIVELLHNADVNRRDGSGDTPLMREAQADYKAKVELLRQHGGQ